MVVAVVPHPRAALCPHPMKDVYDDLESAERGLDRVRKKYGPSQFLHPYECVCGSWHLGKGKTGHRYWTVQVQRRRRLAARRARPVWFLDVDGVISPVEHRPDLGMDQLTFGDRRAAPYWPNLVARIGQLHRERVSAATKRCP